jgi:hypothetical protein
MTPTICPGRDIKHPGLWSRTHTTSDGRTPSKSHHSVIHRCFTKHYVCTSLGSMQSARLVTPVSRRIEQTKTVSTWTQACSKAPKSSLLWGLLFWWICASIPHSAKSCQVQISKSDPKPWPIVGNKKAHIIVTLCGLWRICVQLCRFRVRLLQFLFD